MSEHTPFKNQDLQFDEESHTYWLKSNPDIEFTSATTFIGKFFETFNAPKIASNLVDSHPKYQDYTVSELLSEWNKTATHGTKVHNEVENYVRGELPLTDVTEPKAIQGIKWLQNTFNSDRHTLYPEVKLYSKELQLSGTVDLLAYDKKKDIYLIADWKTNKKISRSGYRGKVGTHPATYNVEDCKYNKYALQMSLYRYILESEYGVPVKRQILVHLKPNNIKRYFTPYMNNILEEMIKCCPLEEDDDIYVNESDNAV